MQLCEPMQLEDYLLILTGSCYITQRLLYDASYLIMMYYELVLLRLGTNSAAH